MVLVWCLLWACEGWLFERVSFGVTGIRCSCLANLLLAVALVLSDGFNVGGNQQQRRRCRLKQQFSPVSDVCSSSSSSETSLPPTPTYGGQTLEEGTSSLCSHASREGAGVLLPLFAAPRELSAGCRRVGGLISNER